MVAEIVPAYRTGPGDPILGAEVKTANGRAECLGSAMTAGRLRRTLQFNYRMLDYALPERLEQVVRLRMDWDRVRNCGPASRRFSSWLIEQWRLPEPYVFEFGTNPMRIALLPTNVLGTLAEHIGLILFSDKIRHAIRRAERERVSRIVGEAQRHYAITRAKLFSLALDQWRVHAVYDREFNSMDEIRAQGWASILRCLETGNPALTRRFELKLPRYLDDLLTKAPDAQPGASHSDSHLHWRLVAQVLRMEFREEWNTCFS